jgi:hypothetical protein
LPFKEKAFSQEGLSYQTEQIISNFKKLEIASLKMDSIVSLTDNESDKYENAIDSYQKKITNIDMEIVSSLMLFSKSYNVKDIEKIRKQTKIKVSESNDKKVLFFSWDNGFSDKVPYYDNVVIYKNASNKMSAKFFSGINFKLQFGENLSVDSVYEIGSDNQKTYFISRSNKCGNICILNKITAFKLEGDSFVLQKVFEFGQEYKDEVSFTYYINENIKLPLFFEVDNQKKVVYVPQLDEGNSNVIGKLSVNIKP